MIGFIISGLVIVVILSVTSFLIAFCILRLAPNRWHRDMHKPMVVTAGVGGMVSGLILIGLFMFVVYLIPFMFHNSSSCGLHTVGLQECWKAEQLKQDEWSQNNLGVKPLIVTWLVTPPWLRSSCNSIDPFFCTTVESSSMLDAWPQYISLILTGLASGLACARTVNKVYALSTVQTEKGSDP